MWGESCDQRPENGSHGPPQGISIDKSEAKNPTRQETTNEQAHADALTHGAQCVEKVMRPVVFDGLKISGDQPRKHSTSYKYLRSSLNDSRHDTEKVSKFHSMRPFWFMVPRFAPSDDNTRSTGISRQKADEGTTQK
jgi:hypothetical protein